MNSTRAASQEPSWLVRKRERIERARGPFDAIMRFLTLDRGDWRSLAGAAVALRVDRATDAVREWRHVNDQALQDREIETVAIRVAADQFAREIEQAAAATGQDRATIAWVVAGLRCPLRPFCTGCQTCFTVTSPHRADVQFDRSGGPLDE